MKREIWPCLVEKRVFIIIWIRFFSIIFVKHDVKSQCKSYNKEGIPNLKKGRISKIVCNIIQFYNFFKKWKNAMNVTKPLIIQILPFNCGKLKKTNLFKVCSNDDVQFFENNQGHSLILVLKGLQDTYQEQCKCAQDFIKHCHINIIFCQFGMPCN